MLRELISHGADVNARSNHEEWERQVTSEPRDKWLPPGGLTPLLFAARENCLACLPVLIEAGADVNATTPDGISAAVIALINGHFDVAGAAARSRNRSESRRLHRPHGAVRGHRLQHDGEVEPARAESTREPFDGPRRGAPRARARRRRQREAEAPAAVSRQARSRQRRDARRRHDAVLARGESRRRARDEAVARARRGSDARARRAAVSAR